jgi:shikimate kinase
MGSGKTTVGALLARRAGRPFVDNDVQLSATAGQSAREVQAELGRDTLHALEHRALRDALRSPVPTVIAAAASVIDDPDLRATLQSNAITIWLTADVDELARRVSRQRHRPLAANPTPQLREQAAARSRLFAEVADLVVDAGGTPDTIVDELLPQLIHE